MTPATLVIVGPVGTRWLFAVIAARRLAGKAQQRRRRQHHQQQAQ